MVNLLYLLLSLIICACSPINNKTDQLFSFPSNAIQPSPPTSGEPNSSAKITLHSTTSFLMNSSTVSPSNLAYDGTRLLWMNTVGTANCYPSDIATFQYLGLDFIPQINSTSVYPGISGTGTCGGWMIFGMNAGFAGMYWQSRVNGSNVGKVSVRENATGHITSTIDFNFEAYGCTEEGLVTVTTTMNELVYGKLNALTCYNDQALLLVTSISTTNAYNGFYK